MASIISAGTTSATALNMSADTSGVLQLASNNGTVGLTVTTAQRIGIGTTTPTELVQIRSASSDPYLLIGGDARDCGIKLNATNEFTALRADGANRLFVNAGGEMRLLTADTLRATISSSGTFSTVNPILVGGMYTYGNGGYFSLGSGGLNYDILIATNWNGDDKILIEWSYQWNAGQGGTFGIGTIYQRYDNAATYFIKVAESTSSPIGSCSVYTSGTNLYFRVTSASGINGYWFVRTSTYHASTLNNF